MVRPYQFNKGGQGRVYLALSRESLFDRGCILKKICNILSWLFLFVAQISIMIFFLNCAPLFIDTCCPKSWYRYFPMNLVAGETIFK